LVVTREFAMLSLNGISYLQSDIDYGSGLLILPSAGITPLANLSFILCLLISLLTILLSEVKKLFEILA